MTFSLSDLHDYLLNEFGILPERVGPETHFRRDLHLAEAEITTVVSHVCKRAGLSDSADIGRNLTDVLDLMVYVLLRSTESTDIETCFNAFLYPFVHVSPDEFRPFRVALLHQLNLN